jgi:hypothetical protein
MFLAKKSRIEEDKHQGEAIKENMAELEFL